MVKQSIILVTGDFPFGNAEESFLRTEFNELIKHYQVTILTRQTDEPLLYPFPGNVQVIRYSQKSNRGLRLIQTLPMLAKLLFRPYVLQELKDALRGCSFSLKKRRLKELLSVAVQAEQLKSVLIPLIEKTSAEFVYSYWCFPIVLSAAELKQKHPNLKVLTRFHGIDLYNERTASGWQPFRTAIAEKCDQLVFACDAGRDYYLSRWGQKWAEKSVVSYLGCIPLTRILPQETDHLTLVSCSNAIPVKRVHLIIEALALLPEHIMVDWHHVGDGTELDNLKQLASDRLTAHSNISWKFWGYVPNHQLDALYQQIQPQLFITTSSTEGGAPVSIQEIFSASIPAVGTAIGGIPELIQNGKTGYLLSEDPDPSEISDTITAFWKLTPQQRSIMGEAAFALWHQKLDAEKNAQDFCQLLIEL